MDNTKELIVVGATSRLGIFICKYPARFVIILLIFASLIALAFGGTVRELLIAIEITLPVLLFILLLVYLLTGKWCYRIEIDKLKNTITFYKLFNKGAQTFKFNGIKILIKVYPHILVGGSDFILHSEFIHDFVSYLPQNTVIEYKGAIAKTVIKDPLIPGSKL